MKGKILAGISLTLFLTVTLFIVFPAKPAFVGTIKIGAIGPQAWIQGKGIAEGIKLSAKQINAAGGIKVNYDGTWTYSATKKAWEIDVVVADTLRGMPDPTTATGTAAGMELVAAGVDMVIGCFRTEATFGAREVLMDANIPFTITGAATNELIDCVGNAFGTGTLCGDCVRDNYDDYKYVFRATPMNSTQLFMGIAFYLQYVMAEKLIPIFGEPLPISVISEDLTWADTIHTYLSYDLFWIYSIGVNVDVVHTARVGPVATDVSSELLAAEAAGARLIIEVLSGPVGRTFAIQWHDLGITAAISGIDVPGQEIPLHWEATAGKAE